MEMKKEKSLIFLIIVVSVISFSYGMISAHYGTFPFEQLRELKNFIFENEYSDNANLQSNINFVIDLENSSDVENKRELLKNFIWKNFEVGNSEIEFEESIFDERYSELDNLEQINKITVMMEYGVDSKSYLFLANESNNKLIIYHQGHDGDFYRGINTINYLLKNNYNVLAFAMPLYGMNDKPTVDIPRIGKFELFVHQQFQFLDNEKFSSIKFFVEPIYVSLNLIEKKYDFEEINMMGISGGGWTSTIYPAIDNRISNSFSIAGGLPIALRNNFQDKGDYEQVLPEMYKLVNYPEMYILASYGENRKHIQIFNKYDPCCYAGEKHKLYTDLIKSKIKDLGTGNFESYTDSTHKEHKISQFALNIILKEITS